MSRNQKAFSIFHAKGGFLDNLDNLCCKKEKKKRKQKTNLDFYDKGERG